MGWNRKIFANFGVLSGVAFSAFFGLALVSCAGTDSSVQTKVEENPNLFKPGMPFADTLASRMPEFARSVFKGVIDSVPGEEMRLKDVMYGLLLPSGNDCAMALALHVAGSISAFVDMMNEKCVTTAQNVTYIETLPVLEFEKKYSTEVVIATSENSHRYAYFFFGETKAKASVNKSITPIEEKNKGQLAISLCIDEKENMFWLIHRLDKIIVPSNTDVDIDELNNDLDSLLNM